MSPSKNECFGLEIKKGNECKYAWEFANQVEFTVLPAFFSEICIPRASTLAKKPAKPQSTKTVHSTGYSMQNKVGPS